MKKNSTTTGIVIIVAAAIVLVGGVWAYLWYANSQTPMTNVQSNLNAQNSNVGTANWITYTNSEYGFEFQYPSNWILNNQKIDGRVVSVTSLENELLVKKAFEGSYYYTNFTVGVCDRLNTDCAMGGTWVNMKDRAILDFLNDESLYRSYQKSSFMPEINVSGVKGYGIIAGGFGANYEIILERNNKIYIIDFPSSENELTAEQKGMLSTFKFTPVK